jgi:hypothetical protein
VSGELSVLIGKGNKELGLEAAAAAGAAFVELDSTDR